MKMNVNKSMGAAFFGSSHFCFYVIYVKFNSKGRDSLLDFAKHQDWIYMKCFEKFFGHRSKTAHCTVFSLRSNPIIYPHQNKNPTLLAGKVESAGTLALRQGYFTLRLKSELFDLRVKYAYPIPQRTRCGARFKTTYIQAKRTTTRLGGCSFWLGCRDSNPGNVRVRV